MGILDTFTRRPDHENAGDVSFSALSESPFVSSDNAQNKEDRKTSTDSSTSESHRPPMALTKDDGNLSPKSTQTAADGLIELRKDGRPQSPVDEKSHIGPDKVSAEPQKKKEEDNKAPEWLAIFFDLAWTATFSNLTSNTPLTTLSTLFAYVVFFLLAWWLWAAQVSYNVKYHRDDWFHRVIMLLYLFIFGAMAAFTQDFDPFSRAVDPKLSSPQDYPTDQYTRISMLGISGLFACARFLLAVSYARVLYYARNHTKKEVKDQRMHLAIQTIAFLLSTIFFGAAAAVVKDDLSPNSFWIRLAFWLAGIGAEVIAFLCMTNKTDGLLNENTMGDRLVTLTTIILGEGLNSNAAALVLAASLDGLSNNVGGAAVSITLIIGFALVLYIAGIQKSMHHSRITIILHFPLHLSLIVLLEALKNLLVLLSLLSTIGALQNRVNHPKPGEDSSTAIFAAFGNMGVDLKEITAPIASGNATAADINELVNKAIAQVYLKIFQNYQLADVDFVSSFTDYIRTQNGLARSEHIDINWNGFSLAQPMNDVINLQRNSAVWIPIAAAVFLFSLGVLTAVGERDSRQRFVTATAATRCLIGILIAILAAGVADSNTWKTLTRGGGLAHITAGAFVLQFLFDTLFVWLTVRFRTAEEVQPETS